MHRLEPRGSRILLVQFGQQLFDAFVNSGVIQAFEFSRISDVRLE